MYTAQLSNPSEIQTEEHHLREVHQREEEDSYQTLSK
jgi:hypothetical protein